MGEECSSHGKMRNAYDVSVEKPEDHLGDLGICGRMLLKCKKEL
jgi:hypothetical protein